LPNPTIQQLPPGTGRLLKEDGTIVNIANLIETLSAKDFTSSLDSGTATSGTTVTLVDTTKSWATNILAGAILAYTHAGVKYAVTVVSNTATTITWTGAAAFAPGAGDAYVISAGASSSGGSGGTVAISQTTPGTTNGVQVNAALPAGTNNIGGVDIASAIPAGTNLMGKVGIDQATANANEVVTKTGSVVAATLAAEITKVIGTVNDKVADGDSVTLGAKADAAATVADTTPFSVIALLKAYGINWRVLSLFRYLEVIRYKLPAPRA
jgi:hypothetical protein